MTLILAAALLALAAPVALGQPTGDLTLGWTNCRVSGGGTDLKTFACNTNANGDVHNLVGAFIPGPGVVALNGADLRVSIYQAGGITPWWEHTGQTMGTGCRGALNFTTNFINATNAVCANVYWTEVPGGPFGGYSYTWPDGAASFALVRMVIAIDQNGASAVPADVETYLFTAQIRNGRTVGTPSCTGCGTPACIAFTRAEMYQNNEPDPFVITESFQPGPAQNPLPNHVVAWQATGGCDMVTPARNRTWGSIKTLYR